MGNSVVKNDAPGGERASAAAKLLGLWNRYGKLPGGPWLFGRMIRFGIPYTASIRPLVQEVRPGYARVQMHDRRRVRNHLNSLHAIALANLGEFTGGLAMTATVPPTIRSILVKLEVEFVKKARGTVTAECHCTVPVVTTSLDHVVRTSVRDASGEEVTHVTATWRLSPV
jgi:acyl-coenzyme A thioesterase PaaI-like protein